MYYYDKTNFPEGRELIGRWIGVAHNVGQALCFWILHKSGIPIARTTVRAIPKADMQVETIKQEAYDQSISRKLGDHSLTDNDFSFELNGDDLYSALSDADDDNDG
jgi:hypothetical protein